MARENRPSAAETLAGVGAAGVGAGMLGKHVGNAIQTAAVKDLLKQEAEGKLRGNLTAEEAAKIEASMGANPNMKFTEIKEPLKGKFAPYDMLDIDEAGDVKMKNGKPQLKPEVQGAYDKLRKARASGKKGDIENAEKALMEHYDKAANGHLYSNKDSYIYAHELGHATGPGMRRSGMAVGKRNLKDLYSLWGATYGPMHSFGKHALPLAGMAAAGRQAHKEMTGEDSRALQAADYLGRAASIGKLFEEGQATARGLKAIHGVQGWKGVRAASRQLLPAWMTYAAAPIGAHIVAPLAVKAGFAAKRMATGEDE